MKNNHDRHTAAVAALLLCAGLLANSVSAGTRSIELDPLIDDLCFQTCSWTVTVDAVESETAAYKAEVTVPTGMDLTVEPSSFSLPPGGEQELTITADVTELPLDEEVQAEILLRKTEPIVLEETFSDTTFPPSGWSIHALEGDTNWNRTTGIVYSEPASAFRGFTVQGNPQDDWLVTHPIEVPATGATLGFAERGTLMSWYEYAGILISDGSCDPDDGDFVEIAEIDDSTGTWRVLGPYNLDAWAEQMVCLAFRYGGDDGHDWRVDDLTVLERTEPDDNFSMAVSVTPRSPSLAVEPETVDQIQFVERQESRLLTISNEGLVELAWSFDPAAALERNMPASGSADDAGPAPMGQESLATSLLDEAPRGYNTGPFTILTREGGVADCDAERGIIIHDDGTAENGYSGNSAAVSEVTFVEIFEPALYPAAIEAVCLAMFSWGPESVDVELVVFADDGADGAPGTELGAVAATVTELEATTGSQTWNSFDLSSLDLSITEGRLFVGVRYVPSNPNVFIAADENPSTPRSGAYWFNDNSNSWATMQSAMPDYRALFIRLVAPLDCDPISEVSWLQADADSGSIDAEASQEVGLTFDSTGLAPGVYEAQVCLYSNDVDQRGSIVPVTLTVEPERFIGGDVTGLIGSGLVLQNNGADDLVIDDNGGFTFLTPLMDGDSYDITILDQPADPFQTCEVDNADGSVSGEDINDVQIDCAFLGVMADAGPDLVENVNTGVMLDGSGSVDLDGNVLGYNWTQTAGTPVTLDDPSAVQTSFTAPAEAGVLEFTLEVDNGFGETDSDTVTVTIEDVAVTGLNAANDSPTEIGQTTTFTATISTGTNVEYTWDFGDGNTGSGDVVDHVYPKSGSYTATVTAANTAGSRQASTEAVVLGQYTVGGTVSGLEGEGLILQINGGDDLAINNNGAFQFETELTEGASYLVTVTSQPENPLQQCEVFNGDGTVGDGPVDSVEVQCTTETFTVGGSVSGLEGEGLVLHNNGGDDLAIDADGSFTFATPVDDGNDYAVTVASQPADPIQTCTVSDGSGRIDGADITAIQVSCSTEPSALTLSSTEIGFGFVLGGEQQTTTITVTNTGTGELVIDEISEPGDSFSLAGGNCLDVPVELQPQESCEIEVSFWPTETATGQHESYFEVLSNADSSPDRVTLRANAQSAIPVPAIGPIGIVLLMLMMVALAGYSLRAAGRRNRTQGSSRS